MSTTTARMVPALMIQRGRAVVPGPEGPVPLVAPAGRPKDLLDLADSLLEDSGRLYVIDLDGIDRDRPQLDYLQELARGGEIWVDAGVRTADQAIDVLVAGAQRAVLSSSELESGDEVGRAWSLSPDIVFELDTSSLDRDGMVPEWGERPEAAAERVRSIGLKELVVRLPGTAPAWEPFRTIARQGPTWAAGPIRSSDATVISGHFGVGGIYVFGADGAVPPPPEARAG